MSQAAVGDLEAYRARRAGRPLQEGWVRKSRIAEHFAVSERTIERWQDPKAMSPPMPKRRMSRGLVLYRVAECQAWHDQMFPG